VGFLSPARCDILGPVKSSTKKSRSTTFCALVAVLSSCASPTKSQEKGSLPPNQSTTRSLEKLKDPSAETEYRALQAAYAKKQYDEVIRRVSDFEKLYRDHSQMPYLRNLKGLSYLAQKRPLLAIVQFQKALDEKPATNVRPFLSFNLASALSDAGQADDSLETLKEITPSELSTDNQSKYFLLMAKNELEKQRFIESARATLSASQLLGPVNGIRASVVELLDRALVGIQKQTDLLQVLRGHETAPLAGRIQARIQPGLDLTAPPVTTIGNSRSIGILLPLSGKFAPFGTRALRAVTMALKTYEKYGVNYTLHIEDTGETVEQALRGLNRLANERGVSAVIGPLMSKGVDQIASRAQTLGLPLITLAQQPGIRGSFIFSAGLTPRLQSRELARYAIQKLGMKRFAILYPKDKFGEQYWQAYWDAVEEFGGKVTAIESYNPGETDYRIAVKKLVGTYYTDARQKEVDAMVKARQELKITKKSRKTAKYFDLEPVVSFDAVFIPDEPRAVGMILPTFAYQDVDKMKFLGVSTWNSPELLERAQSAAESAVFVDALYLNTSNASMKKFIERFQKESGEAPTSIEAMAYDAGLVLDTALKDLPSGEVARTEIQEKLFDIRDLSGVTGKISYRENEFIRNLTLLKVKSGQIEEF
jgi:ABC-type branched-subunit amino acid transport system substrate-binding protein